MPDLYAILGVDRSASQDEIKAAYRNRARTLHPDVNKQADAQERFAELQQAYETLSDEQRRRRYDRTGRADQAPGGFGGGFEADDFDEMFGAFFRGRPNGPRAGGQRTGRQEPKPRDLNIRAPLSLELATIADGGVIKTRTPAGEVIDVNIPPAVTPGATLRVVGKGESGPAGTRGDLLLEIRAKPHPTLTRGAPGKPDPASLDLTTRADISIADATLGGQITVERLGQTIRLTVPPASPSGRALRAKGKGLTNAAGRSGDLFVELRIIPPHPGELTETDIETLRRIADKSSSHISSDADASNT